VAVRGRFTVNDLAPDPLYLLYPSRHLLSAKVRAFADFLISSTR
jgi:DNA-binding transcriptional LysR family regulator